MMFQGSRPSTSRITPTRDRQAAAGISPTAAARRKSG
jgi:hypothetical protein